MFRRRAKKGQCVNQPYLGTREFACHFELVEGLEDRDAPIADSRDLGLMLFDMEFRKGASAAPAFFRASLDRGVIHVPPRASEAVIR
jgi:CRISPR-associated protein Cas5d